MNVITYIHKALNREAGSVVRRSENLRLGCERRTVPVSGHRPASAPNKRRLAGVNGGGLIFVSDLGRKRIGVLNLGGTAF